MSPMFVAEVRPNQVIDQLELKIVEVQEPREIITKYGRQSKVCDAWAEDEKGDRVRVSLWNGEIEKVSEGTRIKITNGWARTFKEELQVSAGLHGQLDIVE
jgi:ssDNA-binding replication factor A large subunit